MRLLGPMRVLGQVRQRAVAAASIVALSALLVGCASFAILYEAALERSLLADSLTRAGVVSNGLQWVVADPGAGPLPSLEAVESALEPPVVRAYPDLAAHYRVQTRVTLGSGDTAVVTIVAAAQTCRGLSLTTGHCPTQRGQVLVSEVAAASEKWRVGTRLEVPRARSTSVADSGTTQEPQHITVVGTYRQLADDTWWQGQQLLGKTGHIFPAADGGIDPPAATDDWVTTVEALSYLGRPTMTVSGPLDRSRLTLDGLSATAAAVARLQQKQQAASDLPQIAATVGVGRSQAAVLVPLLMAQLGVFALTVLMVVFGAYLGLRRPDIAVARLRGSSAGGTARWVLRELAVLCAAGAPLGYLVAAGVVGLVAATVMAPGTVVTQPLTAPLFGLLALVVELTAAAWVVRSVTRQPILDVLRRVPRLGRAGRRPGPAETAIAAVALAGLVTVVSGGAGTGALSLATPTLLALVAGLTVARVVTTAAAWWGRRRLRTGHLVTGLAAVQLGRRPSARSTLVALTVATAVTVFAADASAVAARNREDLARLRSGAEVVLTTDAADPAAFRKAVVDFDAGRGVANPVGVVTQPSSPVTTLAVLPDRVAAVALRPSTQQPYDLSAIAPVASVPRAVGDRATITLRTLAASVQVAPVIAGRPVTAPPPPAAVLHSTSLYLHTLDWLGKRNVLEVDGLPAVGAAAQTRTVRAYCESGCIVTGVDLDAGDDVVFGALRGRLQVSVTIGDQVVDLTRTPWRDDSQVVTSDGYPQTEAALAPAEPAGAGAQLTYVLAQVMTARLTDPRESFTVPTVRAGPPSTSPDLEYAAGLDGTTLTISPVATLPAFPGGSELTAVVNYDALTTLSNAMGDRTRLQVWLSSASAVPAVTTLLTSKGIQVLSRTDRSVLRAGLEYSASAWGLKLATVVGGGAVLLAALSIVVQAAGSGRDRARERSTLRLVGVPDRTLRRAHTLEQLVTLGVAAGTGLGTGVVAARLALPQIPLFQVPSAPFTPSWDTDWRVVLVSAALATTVFLVVAGLVAVRLRRTATPTVALVDP